MVAHVCTAATFTWIWGVMRLVVQRVIRVLEGSREEREQQVNRDRYRQSSSRGEKKWRLFDSKNQPTSFEAWCDLEGQEVDIGDEKSCCCPMT